MILSNEARNAAHSNFAARAKAAQTNRKRHYCNRSLETMREYNAWCHGAEYNRFELIDVERAMPSDGDDETNDDGEIILHVGSEEECRKVGETTGAFQFGAIVKDRAQCKVCDEYDNRKKAKRKESFLVVAWGLSRCYGGPAEGGDWYNRVDVLETRVAFGVRDGLRHAQELKDKYPKPRYSIYSCANNGEPEVEIRCVYNEADPRMPVQTRGRYSYE